MKYLLSIIALLFLIYFGCREEAPLQTDGNAMLKVTALWDTSTVDTVNTYIKLREAKVIITSEYGASIDYTDGEGSLTLRHIPSSTYSLSVRIKHPEDDNIYIVGNISNIEVNSGNMVEDTIYAQAVSSTGIALNEIYCAGPVNNIFYFYDQFIEIYNSSDSVKYLDGMMVYRVSSNSIANGFKGPGADEDDDGDIDGVTYVFKFPGSPGERNYPLEPKEHLVLASDAVDHTKTMSTSINLNNADWEFYNQYSANDIDNPNVPNLINIRADRTVDFLINLSADVIVISSGEDSVWVDGIDIETVLDGVEYQSRGTLTITLDDRIDRGWVPSAPKYSGQSMQRREPGVDTNNGTLDWEIISKPTPGYQ